MAFARCYRLQTTDSSGMTAILTDMKAAVEACAGSVRVEFFHEESAPSRFLFVEHWASKADHRASAEALPRQLFTRLKAVLAAPPETLDLVPIHSPN